MTPNRFATPLLHRRRLTDTVVELRLARPPGFEFRPGQRIRIYHGKITRDYSLASAPGESELRLLIRVFPRGRLSPGLATLPIGSALQFEGPLGYFVFRDSGRTPLFLATGTGVAPFVAMARAGTAGFICLHGARTAAGLFGRDTLEKQAARYVPCLSGGLSEPEGFPGRVTEYLQSMPARGPYDVYLCGGQSMVHDAIEIIDERFVGAHVYSEVFY